MSSNHQLVIIKNKGWYEIHENPCVDNPFKPAKRTLREKHRILEDAIRCANKICQIELIEYGVHVNI